MADGEGIMKLDRRTLVVGAVVIAALVAVSARESRRSTCTGGPCCLPLPGLADFSTNVWTLVPATNQPPAPTAAQPLTNGPK
jgi:hypothetical protein